MGNAIFYKGQCYSGGMSQGEADSRYLLQSLLTPEMHRTWFRGRNLGSSFTAEQQAAVQAGTFDDLFLADYWQDGDIIWRIADMDYWLGTGDTEFTRHHLLIMPDYALYKAQMNATNTTEGGYVGSKMRTTGLEQAKTMAQNFFGSAVLTHREFLVNAVTGGKPSGVAWADSTVDLPNEIMMYGSSIFSPANDGTTITKLQTIDQKQLALMQAVPRFINPNREIQRLRDVVSSADFAIVGNNGSAAYYGALYAGGVRPAFAVG